MHKLIALLLLFLCGVAMAGESGPLKELEVGSYAEIAVRPNPNKYVIQFIPALVAILLSAERKNGAPLTQAQVELIRDRSSVMVASSGGSKAVEDRRGYQDLNPRDVWREWQLARKELQK